MAKRTARHVRKVAATLDTRGARPVAERRLALAATTPDGARAVRQVNPGTTAAGYIGGVPSALGGQSTPDETGNRGTPGNLNTFGFLTGEDYNPDLDGFAMFPNYNKMRISDAQVYATLALMKLPIKGGKWEARPPKGSDNQDQAIADFVQANLIDDDALARSWQHVLDNAMLKFDFGCSAEEITWTLGENSEARVMDLAPRLPRTFYRWVEDPKTGKLAFLQQFAPKNGQWGYFNIPASELVLHVHAREGNAYYGRSILRAAYPHWWWKQQLYRIDMIGHDRFHVGIPRAKLTNEYNPETASLKKLEDTLKGLRSHDRAYMVQPWGVEYDIYGQQSAGAGAGNGLILSVEHHNLMIARNMLQAFQAQGEQRHGSFGAAKVSSDVYFDALVGEAGEIGSELKQGVVKRLCDLNFDMRNRKYPTVVCSDISAVDFPQLATALAALADKNLITPDDELEAWLRSLADAPDLPEALKGMPRKVKAVQVAVPGQTPEPDNNPEDAAKQVAAARRLAYVENGRAFGRKPTDKERKVLDLHGLPDTLDTQTAGLVKSLAEIRSRQLKAVAHKIAQKDGRKTGAFTDIRHAHVTMPFVADMVAAIRTAQKAALTFGQDSVRKELKAQGVKDAHALATAAAGRQPATSSLVSSARITAQQNADTWRGRILDTGLRIRRTGVQGQDLEDRIIDALEEEAETGARRAAALEVHEAFGLGRALVGNAFGNDGDGGEAIYSAILDANTCDVCRELDGDVFPIGSDDYEENMPPNVSCEGGDACRCVYLYGPVDDQAGAEGEE